MASPTIPLDIFCFFCLFCFCFFFQKGVFAAIAPPPPPPTSPRKCNFNPNSFSCPNSVPMVSPSPPPTSAILVPIYFLVLAVFLIVRSLGNIVSNKRNQNLKITTWGQIVVIVSRNKSWFIKKYLFILFSFTSDQPPSYDSCGCSGCALHCGNVLHRVAAEAVESSSVLACRFLKSNLKANSDVIRAFIKSKQTEDKLTWHYYVTTILM